MHVLPHSVPPTLQQATTDPRLCGDSWTLTGKSGSVSCGVTAPFSWVLVHKLLSVPSESISKSCVSSGSSVVGLMVTSSKWPYAIPKSAAPRALVPVAGHCWPVLHSRCSSTVQSQSLWGPWVLVCTRFVWVLLAGMSLAGMGFDSKREFAPPTVLLAQRLKRLPAMQETRVWSLGWEDPLEKEMATDSSILAWRNPWREEPGRLPSMGSQRVGHDWATSLHRLAGASPLPLYLRDLLSAAGCSSAAQPNH